MELITTTRSGMVLQISMLLMISLSAVSSSAPYQRQIAMEGSTFFDNFAFFNRTDPTHGFVEYVDSTTALAMGLVKGGTPSYMGAEMSTQSTGANGRKSVRLESKLTFDRGLFILDLNHMPAGCATWPAWWLVGPNWPSAGEIDIIEGVNVATHDATTLHTDAGCTMVGRNESSFTGTPSVGSNAQPAENCDVHASGQYNNQGCGIKNSASTTSYGAPFNAAHGGVVALEWDATAGIAAWFWPHDRVPADVKARKSPDPSGWSLPYARFPFTVDKCDGAKHFHDHQIVFDLTFCGDWAGADFQSGACAQTTKAPTCEAWVKGNALTEAFWEINYLDVYTRDGQRGMKEVADGVMYEGGSLGSRRAVARPAAGGE